VPAESSSSTSARATGQTSRYGNSSRCCADRATVARRRGAGTTAQSRRRCHPPTDDGARSRMTSTPRRRNRSISRGRPTAATFDNPPGSTAAGGLRCAQPARTRCRTSRYPSIGGLVTRETLAGDAALLKPPLLALAFLLMLADRPDRDRHERRLLRQRAGRVSQRRLP